MYGFIVYNDKRDDSDSLKDIAVNGLIAIFYMIYGFGGFMAIFMGLTYLSVKYNWSPDIVLGILGLVIIGSFVCAIVSGIKGIIKTLNKEDNGEGSSEV